MSAPNAQKRLVVRGPGRGPRSGVRANLALGSRGPGHFGAGVPGSGSLRGGLGTSHTATGMYGRVHSYADYLYSCDTYENYGSFLFVHTKIRLSDVSRQRSHPQEH